jgi:ribonucleotide reductase class II
MVSLASCAPHPWGLPWAPSPRPPVTLTPARPIPTPAVSGGAADSQVPVAPDADAQAGTNAASSPNADFPATAPAANPVFYRTYSRKTPQGRESWHQVAERNLGGLRQLGQLNDGEVSLLRRMQQQQLALPSGRWLWIGGTPWIEQRHNFSGAYNCTSTNLVDWEAFGLMMDLAMMGCGTGAIIEPRLINRLPAVRQPLVIEAVTDIGQTPAGERQEHTSHTIDGQRVAIKVGDTRRGWVDSYQLLLELSSDPRFDGPVQVTVDLSDVRPVGERLKGFGGMANPVKLRDLYGRVAQILGKAVGRQLTSVECCLLIDEAAVTIVAGNIRRSAGMRQFSADDVAASTAKDNLWQQDSDGNWRIDPERDSLRMANHTRVFHSRPSREVVLEAVTRQFQSGEGAIQFAPEAIARSNADLLPTPELRRQFIDIYCEQGREEAGRWLQLHQPELSAAELEHRLGRYGLNPCGEILGADFHCNLAEIHLNRIDPSDHQAQADAFRAGGLAVACLLNHDFEVERYRQSRAWDPIVGVSFTGLFDFFVHAFGTPWLQWWEAGRPETEAGQAFKRQEAEYLARWKETVNGAVWDYCDRHGLRRPNRCTTVQPAGTKSLLTGASPGWHPPKAQRFIRRITFRKDDPVALACMEYGYTIVPSQSDKDEQGRLLDDAFDPRCTEWLVEIPTEVSWANLPGADQVDINNFSALAQFDFYMQVQRHYTAHNTSATVEFREHEVEPLADAIHQAIEQGEGYISAALLARFDANATFPRLPFEPIDHATYTRLSAEVVERRRTDDFFQALQRYDGGGELLEAGPAGCDSDKCLLPLAKPEG